MVGAIEARNEGIDQYEIHEVLQNKRRYHVIEYLQRTVGTITLRELAEAVAERETGESPPPRNIRQSVYTTLHQIHLPKLQSAGVIEYDKNRKTVSLRKQARELDVYMEVVMPLGLTWIEYYRTLGVVSLLVILFSELSVSYVPDVDSLLTCSFFLFVFVFSVSYQLWQRRWVYLQSLLANADKS